MRWPWSRKSSGECAGTRARREATQSLRDAEDMWPEVNRVAESLRNLRERNHFAESVSQLFQGASKR